MKRQSTEWENWCDSYSSEEKLKPTIYKELKKNLRKSNSIKYALGGHQCING
jgi:hypothetical protein